MLRGLAVARCLSVRPSVCLSVRLSVRLSIRRPSVCLSVTRRHSVKKVKHIIKVLPPSGSHITPIFAYQTVWQYSDVDPPIRGVECKGV